MKHTKKNKFAEELFDAYDDGPESYRIINGCPLITSEAAEEKENVNLR